MPEIRGAGGAGFSMCFASYCVEKQRSILISLDL
jgi:hypothetical protein